MRLNLCGEVELWINEAEAAGESWVKNDAEILRRLSDRYETSESVEMMIQRFETMRQLDGESLESYMVRVRRAGSYAFPKRKRELSEV